MSWILFYHHGKIIPISTWIANFSLGLWSLHYQFMNVIIILKISLAVMVIPCENIGFITSGGFNIFASNITITFINW